MKENQVNNWIYKQFYNSKLPDMRLKKKIDKDCYDAKPSSWRKIN